MTPTTRLRRARSRPSRPGAAGLALITVMVVLQLIIVGAVVSGARDQDLTVQRLDASRAFFAAEAGANMAIREYAASVDYDGDGAVGSLSNDNNTGDDPAFGNARVYATATTSGPDTTVVVRGRSGVTQHRVDTVLRRGGGGASGGTSAARMVVYGDPSGYVPKARTWNGSSWSSSSSTLNVGASPRWVTVRSCTRRSELVAAVSDGANDLNVMIYSGSSWGNLLEMTNNLQGNGDRRYDVAYEQLSGRALVVYRVGSVSTFYYRTWNGTAWSSQQSVASPVAGGATFVKLVPKPGTNEIMLVVLTSSYDVAAMVWNGSSFGNSASLETSAFISSDECFDAVYERSSGRCMVAWAPSSSSTPKYRIWTGTSWLSSGSAQDVGARPHYIRMAADPVSNRIMALTLNDNSDIHAMLWNGSSWGTPTVFETNAPATDRRLMDVAYEPAGTRALAMYARNSTATPFYRVYDGTNWSVANTGPNLTYSASIIAFSPSTSGQEILIGHARRSDGAFNFMRWNGSSIIGTQMLASDLSGPTPDECFMISDIPPAGSSTAVVSWAEAEP